ncbi:hypothetical protein BDF19DRAFT_434964 [Syncephalis fuscata]|nr:hypothetical protein BDF19DRAFT_434964 [Syncephalis fuscata]
MLKEKSIISAALLLCALGAVCAQDAMGQVPFDVGMMGPAMDMQGPADQMRPTFDQIMGADPNTAMNNNAMPVEPTSGNALSLESTKPASFNGKNKPTECVVCKKEPLGCTSCPADTQCKIVPDSCEACAHVVCIGKPLYPEGKEPHFEGHHGDHFEGHHGGYPGEHHRDHFEGHHGGHFEGHHGGYPDEHHRDHFDGHHDGHFEGYHGGYPGEHHRGHFDDHHDGHFEGHHGGHFEGHHDGRFEDHHDGHFEGHHDGHPEEYYGGHPEEHYGKPDYESNDNSYGPGYGPSGELPWWIKKCLAAGFDHGYCSSPDKEFILKCAKKDHSLAKCYELWHKKTEKKYEDADEDDDDDNEGEKSSNEYYRLYRRSDESEMKQPMTHSEAEEEVRELQREFAETNLDFAERTGAIAPENAAFERIQRVQLMNVAPEDAVADDNIEMDAEEDAEVSTEALVDPEADEDEADMDEAAVVAGAENEDADDVQTTVPVPMTESKDHVAMPHRKIRTRRQVMHKAHQHHHHVKKADSPDQTIMNELPSSRFTESESFTDSTDSSSASED